MIKRAWMSNRKRVSEEKKDDNPNSFDNSSLFRPTCNDTALIACGVTKKAAKARDCPPMSAAATKSSRLNKANPMLVSQFHGQNPCEDELEEDELDHSMISLWEAGRVMDAVETNQKSTNYGRQAKFGEPLCKIVGSTRSCVIMPIHRNSSASSIRCKKYSVSNNHVESSSESGSKKREKKHGPTKKVTYADEHAFFHDERQKMSKENAILLSRRLPHHSGPVCVDDEMDGSTGSCVTAGLPTSTSKHLQQSILSQKNFHFKPKRLPTHALTPRSVKGPLYTIPWTARHNSNPAKSPLTTVTEIQLQKRLSFGESRVAL